MREDYRAAHRAQDTHDADTSVVTFPFPLPDTVPTGGAQPCKELLGYLDKLRKKMDAQRAYELQCATPELMRLVATEGFCAALAAADQAGFLRGCRQTQQAGRYCLSMGPFGHIYGSARPSRLWVLGGC